MSSTRIPCKSSPKAQNGDVVLKRFRFHARDQSTHHEQAHASLMSILGFVSTGSMEQLQMYSERESVPQVIQPRPLHHVLSSHCKAQQQPCAIVQCLLHAAQLRLLAHRVGCTCIRYPYNPFEKFSTGSGKTSRCACQKVTPNSQQDGDNRLSCRCGRNFWDTA